MQCQFMNRPCTIFVYVIHKSNLCQLQISHNCKIINLLYNWLQYVKVQNCKKVVIISTSTNLAFYQRTMKMILEKNTFEDCTIITAAHSSVLNYEDTVPLEDRIDYAKLKRDVKSWMHSKQLQVMFILFLFI